MVDYCAMASTSPVGTLRGWWIGLDVLTARARGRWVISWQAYVIGVSLHVVLIGGTGGSLGAEPTTLQQTPYWIILGLIASAAVGLYALAINYTVFRRKRTRLMPLWQVIAFHIGVGLIFAGTLLLGSRRLPVEQVEGAVGFVIATVCIGVWFGITMSLLLQARERYHADREELIELSVAAELTSIAETEVLAALTSSFTDDLTSSLAQLEPIRDELQGRLQQMRSDVDRFTIDASWRAVAHRLRQASDDAVRPLSRELWQVTEQRYPNPSWREILIDTVRHPIAWAVPTALIVVVGYLRTAMMSFGVVPGIVVTVLMASVIGLLLRALRSPSGPRTNGVAFWSIFAVAQALGLAVVLGLNIAATRSMSTEVAGSVVAMTISVFAPAAIATLNGARGAVLTRLRRHTSRERINQIAQGRHLARLARETATHLHGTVQTSLIACAAAIEQAADSEDPQQLMASMERAIEIATAPTGTATVNEADLACAVGRTVAAWQGLVEAESRIDQEVAGLSGEVAMTVARVVEECLANAVRHGDATTVRIGVHSHPSGVEVVVEDDGMGKPADARPAGLGSMVLMEATQGRVAYEPAMQSTERPGLRVRAVIGPSPHIAGSRS